jgi:hypothetical protein
MAPPPSASLPLQQRLAQLAQTLQQVVPSPPLPPPC